MHSLDNKNETLRSILEKPFGDRTQSEHSFLIDFLSQTLPEYSELQRRCLSLLCDVFTGLNNEQKRARFIVEDNSILLCPIDDGQPLVIRMKNQLQLKSLPNQGFLVVLTSRSLKLCDAIGDRSIDETIKNMRAFEYLQDIPKKRFYQILHNMQILSFTFNQIVYLEKQSTLEDYCIYVVKDGDFTFLKRETQTHKNVELCTFSEGSIFGTEEQYEFTNAVGNMQRKWKERRAFTVRCQSSRGHLYKFQADFFNAFMRKSCENLLRNHNQKLKRFLQERFVQAEISLTSNAQFVTQPFKRSLSLQVGRFTPPPILPTIPEKQPRKTNGQKGSPSLPSLNMKSQFPSRKRLLPKEETKKLSSQYQEQKLILMKQYKCAVMRQVTRPKKIEECKGEVLLNLMKTSYQFEKFRHKKGAY